MKCSNCIKLIPSVLEDDITTQELNEFKKHIEECYECRDEYNFHKEAREGLKENIDIEGFVFTDCRGELMSKIDKNKYNDKKKNSLRKNYSFLKKISPIVAAVILITISVKYTHHILEGYNNKPIKSEVNSEVVKIIPSKSDLFIRDTKQIIIHQDSIAEQDEKIIDSINLLIQDGSIESYSKDLNDKKLINEYIKKDGFMLYMYLGNERTTKFKTDTGEVSYTYNTIRIPIVKDDRMPRTIFFSTTKERTPGEPEQNFNINSLTTKNKDAFDKFISYCNAKAENKLNELKPYHIRINCRAFGTLIENYKAKFSAVEYSDTFIEDSLNSQLLDFSRQSKTSALKYFEILSKDSDVKILNSNVNDKMLLLGIGMKDDSHGKYKIYAVCYNNEIKYCFIDSQGQFFSLRWNSLDQIVGKSYSDWLSENNYDKNTPITIRNENKDTILNEYVNY